MSSRQERQDYFTANCQIYEDLTAAFESALQRDVGRVLLYRAAAMEDFIFVEGQYTAEEMTELQSPEESPEDQWQAAEEQNAAVVRLTTTDTNVLRKTLNYLRPDDQPPQYDFDGELIPLPFETAVCRRTEVTDDDDPTLDGHVSILELFGIGQEGEINKATSYRFSLSVQGVRDSLWLVAVNDTPEAVLHTIEPEEDPLYDRCVDMFGFESKAAELLWGKFSTEEEVDSALATILAATKDIYPIEQVEELLSDIRERALAQAEANKLDLMSDFSKPSNDKLLALTRFLQTIWD